MFTFYECQSRQKRKAESLNLVSYMDTDQNIWVERANFV